ncbi:helix-turn-helix domain-containing protein [Devosia sp. 63-57]|uniref:winged helix-turn-helix domain-containing protein n=1 Tax=Devosia sp. 63-57 TaxID=1895751 RepID=UPI00086EE997|nr:helix-turn-helix domain-containing protein [Devosia sp. 63-57]ODT49168.1 MAG: transcriptional regulator [Pelagibacterium sp. SCN 63-126]ODU83550.1 MAG: transcriptional regulator [Pelagibacterium sp. SCN 63-17]OJX43744.1 MAG: transcriptional regulator [Devosia sp. 63-57]
MSESRTISRVKPDAMALRALAHPQRLRMLGMLRIDGPATATRLAERMGLNSGATSYHLRQLARHGFIEEDIERGNGRDRWWKAAHETTTFLEEGDDEDALDAGLAFAEAALSAQIKEMQRALARHPQLSPEWRKASTISDYVIPLTAERAESLLHQINALLLDAMAHAPKAGEAYAPGVELVSFILHAFPRAPEEEGA